ncbi:hemagglutinin/amebocyte aggregation factor-like [Littorina saxatilis]|uniref:hemagglutinin/amebocyte aggregation factor-like n=1 Tax=Littorina saxatilis TaxID=31220 RepID=UPI0038B4671E
MALMTWFLLATSCLLFAPVDCGGWLNDWNQKAERTCSYGSFLSNIDSQHNNQHEDRQFRMSCRSLPVCGGTPSCAWTSDLNSLNAVVDYQCPGGGYVAGMSSYHNNHHEDRRYSLYCCNLSGHKTYGCYTTGYVNNHDETYRFSVPYNHVLAGMKSEHSNGSEDRRFKFTICRMA